MVQTKLTPRQRRERQLQGLLFHRCLQRRGLDRAIEGIQSKLYAMGVELPHYIAELVRDQREEPLDGDEHGGGFVGGGAPRRALRRRPDLKRMLAEYEKRTPTTTVNRDGGPRDARCLGSQRTPQHTPGRPRGQSRAVLFDRAR